MIHYDGNVPMCINDEYEDNLMGNIQDQNVGALWKRGAFVDARELHQQGLRVESYKSCAKCSLTREGHGK